MRWEEVFIELADDEDESCPACLSFSWLRGVARTGPVISWAIWCACCGKPLDQSKDSE